MNFYKYELSIEYDKFCDLLENEFDLNIFDAYMSSSYVSEERLSDDIMIQKFQESFPNHIFEDIFIIITQDDRPISFQKREIAIMFPGNETYNSEVISFINRLTELKYFW